MIRTFTIETTINAKFQTFTQAAKRRNPDDVTLEELNSVVIVCMINIDIGYLFFKKELI